MVCEIEIGIRARRSRRAQQKLGPGFRSATVAKTTIRRKPLQHSPKRQSVRKAAALLAVASIATMFVSNSAANASIGDTGNNGASTTGPSTPKAATNDGFIRVLPTKRSPGAAIADFENQVAPVIQANSLAQPGADIQLMIPNDFQSGDRIVLSVFPDALPPNQNTAGTLGNGSNCTDLAHSLAYASTPTLAVAGPYLSSTTTWANAPLVGADEQVTPGFDTPDILTPGTATVLPTATVTLGSSTQCLPNGKTDRVIITFNNASTPTAANTNTFVLTLKGFSFNVGSKVNPGPIHIVPFAQQGLSSSIYRSVPLFGGNDTGEFNDLNAASTFPENVIAGDGPGADVHVWTNGAFISPISVSAIANSVVADNTPQPIGGLTLNEVATDGLGNGTYQVQVTSGGSCPAVSLLGSPTVVVSGNGATAVGTVSNVGFPTSCGFTLNLAAMDPTLAGAVTISGIVGTVSSGGDLVAAITQTPDNGTGPNTYLKADDKTNGSGVPDINGGFTDVNDQTLITVAFATAVGVPTRLGGEDRYDTSASIAAQAANCSEWAVIASGENFPDALSANYLAGAIDTGVANDIVPVLLVRTDSIPPSILTYLHNAGVKHVEIVGGGAAVSFAVSTALESTLATRCQFDSPNSTTQPVEGQMITVQRIAGADRYETNRLAVNAGSALVPSTRANVSVKFLTPAKKTAIVATGSSFADALSAGPLAYEQFPLILTDGSVLSANAQATLQNNDITQVIIVGGTSAVSTGVQSSIEALGITSVRLAGADRFATATAIADFDRAAGASAPTAGPYDGGRGHAGPGAYLANGITFPDALSAAPYVADFNGQLVLTATSPLSPATQSWFVANRAALFSVTAFGLGNAISTSTLAAANAAIS